jgi:hypothetical protein
VLKRYDIADGQTSTLLDYSGAPSVVLGGQISPDKRWLALVAKQDPDHPAALFLIASDGTHLLNIDCNAASSRPVWSPDGRQLAFASLTPGTATSIRTVNLTTGAFNMVAQGSYQPLAWADNTHLLVSSSQGDPLSGIKTLSLIDTTQGTTQHPRTVATAPSICASYTISSDGQHVYSSTCTLAPIANCRSGYGFQGTGSINVQSSLSGNSTALYKAANLGILALQPSGSSLLFYRYADIGDAGQSGVWLRHADGSLHHLAGDKSQNCLNIESSSVMPALASNDSSYAFYNGETTKSPLAITVGSLTDNSATTIATLNIGDGILTLIGMA